MLSLSYSIIPEKSDILWRIIGFDDNQQSTIIGVYDNQQKSICPLLMSWTPIILHKMSDFSGIIE